MFRGLLPSLMVGAALFGVFVLVLPQYDAIKSMKQEIEVRKEILKEREGALEKVFSLQRQLKQRTEEMSRLSILIPPNNQSDQIVSSLEQVGIQSGVIITRINMGSSAGRNQNYSTLNMDLQITGNYSAFLNFVKLMEQNLRLYDITKISISKGSTPGSLAFNTAVSAYFLKN